ncbi:MAG: protein kinase, partial [Myxococcales bacterium]|nr:protein kinase [Myxococcales bacterium]
HPNIVAVHEVGCHEGFHYFTMDLIEGDPLDAIIKRGEKMPVDRVLQIVMEVAQAIHYAHGKGIIHRDLKPANVLLDTDGHPKVTDFGLAKNIDHKSMLTRTGAVVGTPFYMPPEQARGDAVDERADVFSLGAMLYHVLAGAPPYQARGATDVIAHAIAGKVLPLRDRARDAPADLIAIVERAMAQDPAGRYPSARELAEELRRFQTGQMVGAHHYSVRERLVRFVRRHRGAVTIAAIALVGFAIGGTIAVRRVVAERDRATAARAVAEQRRAAAEKLVDYMVSDMRDRLDAVGKLALMSGLGENVRDYYHDLAGLPGGMRPEDVDRMAVALGILGDAEQQSGDLDAALATFEDARTRLRALVEADPGSPATARRRAAIGRATVAIGMIHQARGRIDDALASYRDAVALFDDARAAAPADRDLLLGAADAHDRIGDLERNRGAPDEAILDYDQARRFRQDVIDRFGDDDLLARYDLSTSELKLGSAEQNRGASAAAIVHYRACVAGREALAAAEPERVTFRHGLAYAQIVLGDMLRETGALGEARGIYAQALAALDALVQKDPDNTQWRRDRGNVLASLGFVLADLGDARGALDRYAAGLANHAELTARDPDNASWQMDVARLHTRAGDAHLFVGDVAAALASYRAARDIRAALVARDAR